MTLLLCAAPAAALPNAACPSGPLHVGYFKVGPAYREAKGYDVALVHELALRLHCFIESEDSLPRLRVLKMLETGQLDIGTSTIPTPERKQYTWIFPYLYSKNMILLHPSVQARSLETLPNDPALRWGAIRGYRHGPLQDQFLAKMAAAHKLVQAEDEDDLYKMLGNGVVTGIFAHPFSYELWMQHSPQAKDIVALDLYGDSEAVASGLALSKARFSREAAELWHEELRKMSRDGSLYNIFRQFLSESSARRATQKPLD
ncbi:ABC transporter substrate-binding protein [Chromobacterium sp. IIBBL 290-4]|uniref:substrate-binding periplasmic protein n=1 Tax=Chromobacterium sp. IIBBL 290-4 TaxID=2953890 RepID=UPI0020B6A9AB|nr:transporter substrate-binding domain-containing protein [Chromobacterium sp. IIBBL 290-4]UTH73882.1 transporter substrate-binding domain-containing protein [Chromobacterium sp. IIBBL 290-4]